MSMFLDYLKISALPFAISLVSVWILHPQIIKIARLKEIVDNPNARKLQKEPVPIMGGVAVFFGIFMSLMFSNVIIECSELFILLTAMLLMLYVGAMDDILDLPPWSRLVAQIGAALVLVYLARGFVIDDLMGLLGIGALPAWVAVPLTVFAIVGIINATNLIDGVDGLSSGFGMMACLVFTVVFYRLDDVPMVVLSASTLGALLLFFLHNVFGKTSKMFIGDSGTLMLGIVLAASVTRIISQVRTPESTLFTAEGASAIPFTLAVLSVPVFDTLRVMLTRILHRHSPFHPDKTHLHHMFIDLGFTHVITTVCVLSLNTLVLLLWTAVYYAGASVEVQIVAVVASALAVTVGLYQGVECFRRRSPECYARTVDRIRNGQPKRDGWMLVAQRIIDRI